jgi:hypothetical protein
MAWHRIFKNWWSLHGSGQSVGQSVSQSGSKVRLAQSVAPSVNVLFGQRNAVAAHVAVTTLWPITIGWGGGQGRLDETSSPRPGPSRNTITVLQYQTYWYDVRMWYYCTYLLDPGETSGGFEGSG